MTISGPWCFLRGRRGAFGIGRWHSPRDDGIEPGGEVNRVLGWRPSEALRAVALAPAWRYGPARGEQRLEQHRRVLMPVSQQTGPFARSRRSNITAERWC